MTTPKVQGGCCCAISTCSNYSGKAKRNGRTDLKFHRFPKNDKTLREWVHKCKRVNKWNPSNSFVCSDHFKEDDYERDLKAELLGYTPRYRRLKPEAVPSLNLPLDHSQSRISESAVKRKNRMEAKLAKQVHDELIASSLKTPEQSPPTISPSSSRAGTPMADDKEIMLQSNQSTVDYELMYNELLEKYEILKKEKEQQEAELLSLKNPTVDYKAINERLRTNLIALQKELNVTKRDFKVATRKSSKELKVLSKQNTRAIENEARNLVSSVFSQNQFDIIAKKKKKVHWSKDEIVKALTLRFISKQAYLYVKETLHYPLPGVSSLQRWVENHAHEKLDIVI